MQIIISDDAKSAITDIYDYSYNISSNYASRIVNKLYDAIYDLQDSPYIGRYVPELLDKQFRERICEKYRIIYYISEKDNTIFIRYIFCVRQNSNLFFKVHEKELFDFFNRLFNYILFVYFPNQPMLYRMLLYLIYIFMFNNLLFIKLLYNF